METWSLIFTILSFIIACFSLGAMIKIAISTSRMERGRSSLFQEILIHLKSMDQTEPVAETEAGKEKGKRESQLNQQEKEQGFTFMKKELEKIKESKN